MEGAPRDSIDKGQDRKVRRYRQVRRWRRRLEEAIGPALYLVALALVIMASWAAYANVQKRGWGSDAAAWIQAAGSIAAIAGAAWLSQSEARRGRRFRREQNEEAAWYVRFAIVQAQFESQIIAAELVNRTVPVEKFDVRGWRQRATTSATGLNALAVRTDHIHPAVTHVTMNAKVLMDDLIHDLAALDAVLDKGAQPDDELIGRIVSPHHALIELIDHFDARMRGIKIALDEGDDMLPLRQWRTWDDNFE